MTCPFSCAADVVDLVLRAELEKLSYEVIVARLQSSLGLPLEDAELAWDRTLGGLVRAATGLAANAPSKRKDPIAWASYQRCKRDPALIGAVRPEYAVAAAARPWWRFWARG
jgi:hypothetical protein